MGMATLTSPAAAAACSSSAHPLPASFSFRCLHHQMVRLPAAGYSRISVGGTNAKQQQRVIRRVLLAPPPSALPEPQAAAALVLAAGTVGVAATLLLRRSSPSSSSASSSQQQQEEAADPEGEECWDCGGTGLCGRCKGEGFVFKQLSQETATKARKAAKNMATRYTAGLPTKWTYCNKCSSTRSCTTCRGSGRIKTASSTLVPPPRS